MTVIENGGGAKAYLLDLFFPNRCPFCGDFIEYNLLCCRKCFDKVLWADENICLRCGKSVLDGCKCGEKELRYDMCIPAAYYSDGAKEAIYALKFHSGLNAAEIFGKVIRDRLKSLSLSDGIDAAVPVPMSAKQRRVRGYNQAEKLAEAIVKNTDIPLENKLLVRKNVKVSQHFLGAKERAEAVSCQYSAEESDRLRGKTVLLVDDVITTGATLDYCAYLLKERLHAEKVICAVGTTV